MRLDDWMNRERISNAAFAGRQPGWSGERVRRYRNGEREPDLAAMKVIFELTAGDVTPNDWVGVGPRSDRFSPSSSEAVQP